MYSIKSKQDLTNIYIADDGASAELMNNEITACRNDEHEMHAGLFGFSVGSTKTAAVLDVGVGVRHPTVIDIEKTKITNARRSGSLAGSVPATTIAAAGALNGAFIGIFVGGPLGAAVGAALGSGLVAALRAIEYLFR